MGSNRAMEMTVLETIMAVCMSSFNLSLATHSLHMHMLHCTTVQTNKA